MVTFTKELSGVIIQDSDSITHELPIYNAELKMKNRNRFNKPFLEQKSSCHAKERYVTEISREDYDRKRKERKELMELQNELKDEIKTEVENNRIKREEIKKKKAENENKNLTFQVIDDNKKIRKMNKRVRSRIIKMPAEHFEKYLEKSKAAWM